MATVEGDYVAPAARDTYFQNEPNLIAPFDFDYAPCLQSVCVCVSVKTPSMWKKIMSFLCLTLSFCYVLSCHALPFRFGHMFLDLFLFPTIVPRHELLFFSF